MLGEKSRVKQEEMQKYKNVPLGGTMGYLEHVTRMAISESWLTSNSIQNWIESALH
jgi:predicted alpha/beta-fold hydrolase